MPEVYRSAPVSQQSALQADPANGVDYAMEVI